MDTYAVIGKLYVALLEAEEQKVNLISLVKAVKDGEMALDRIGVTDNSVSVNP